MNNNKNTIFVQIASYRDPELYNTLTDLLEKAKYPNNLHVCVANQFGREDSDGDLDVFRKMKNFLIMDIPCSQSKGACWARNTIQQEYDGQKYTLQLDSHHRFVEDWDVKCIKMIKDLQKEGSEKPLLTSYLPSYDPENDPKGRVMEPWWMQFDRFIPEGAVFFLPANIPVENRNKPIPARFYSAHFCFTLGQFAIEVQHDPEFYFHGEEISIAVRAYTHGYDLYHPHQIIAWHEYTRKGRTKQWDDDKDWGKKNTLSHKRNRMLFGMDGECSPCEQATLGRFGFGIKRTLDDYERYAGLRFMDRSVQMYTVNNYFAPNPVIDDYEEYNNSFINLFKHCIDVGFAQVPKNDYTFWAVIFEDKDGNSLYREDADEVEIRKVKNDPDGYCKIWRTFNTDIKPHKWIVWPFSAENGWEDQITGLL